MTRSCSNCLHFRTCGFRHKFCRSESLVGLGQHRPQTVEEVDADIRRMSALAEAHYQLDAAECVEHRPAAEE